MPPLLRSIAYDAGLRVRNAEPSRCMPFVFLRDMREADARRLASIVADGLAGRLPSLAAALRSGDTGAAYLASLLEAVLGGLYFQYLRHGYGLRCGEAHEQARLGILFPEPVAREIMELSSAGSCAVLDRPFVSVGARPGGDAASGRLIREDGVPAYRSLSMLFYGLWNGDAASGRRSWASRGEIYGAFPPELAHDATAALIRCIGASQAVCAADRGTPGICRFRYSYGDMAFRFILDEYGDGFRECRSGWSLALAGLKDGWEPGFDVRNDAASSAFDAARSRFLKRFLDDNSGSLPEWFLPYILS